MELVNYGYLGLRAGFLMAKSKKTKPESAPEKGASKQSTTLRFYPATLGVGVTFAAFLILANSTSPLLQLNSTNWSITTGCLIGIIFASLLIQLIRALFKTPFRSKTPSTLAFVSLAGFILVCIGIPISLTMPLVSGLIAGGGFLAVMTVWSVIYATMMPEESLVHTALALAVSSVLYTLCFLPFLNEIPFVYACVLMLVSVILQIKAGIRLSPQAQEDHTYTTPLDIAEKTSTLQRIKDIVSVLWKPLLSAMIAAFILGLVHNPHAAGSEENFAIVSHPLMSIGAPLFAAVLVITAFLVWKKNFTLHVFCDVVVPIAVSLLLIIPMINTESPWLNMLTTLLSQSSFALIALATWTVLASSVRTSNVSAWTVFTIASALLAASTLTGIVLVHYIGKGGQILSLILLTAFLVLMVVDFAVHDKTRSVERELQHDVFERFLKERCETLTEQYHLTTRESEILPYLARGYSHVYTAQELYVSENTVRTHVKHIYTKLEVSSREELITLIDTK